MNNDVANRVRIDHLRRLYELLDRLEEKSGGKRLLAGCSSQTGWPQRGVYFFFENGEHRSDSGSGPRVVRVGTHALSPGSKTSLWNRLSQHRGSKASGSGNHRGSIFRLIVGTALATQHGETIETWGKGDSAPAAARDTERDHEKRVSEYLGAMPFLWVEVPDEPGKASLRGFIERNSIALLSNYLGNVADPASPTWLGHASDREKVRRSGLWNQNHVDEQYDSRFLDELDRLI
jgi:hypothetical protein